MISLTVRLLSWALGMPFRVWVVAKAMDMILQFPDDMKVRVVWDVRHAFAWLHHKRSFDEDGHQIAAGPTLYLGHFAGTCKLGHRHYSLPSVIAFSVIWWNLKHRRPLLNFVDQTMGMALSGLEKEITRCGGYRGRVQTEEQLTLAKACK